MASKEAPNPFSPDITKQTPARTSPIKEVSPTPDYVRKGHPV